MSGTVHFASLAGSRTIATDVVEYLFTLAPEDAALSWRPGQFISIDVGVNQDGTPILRSYSLASLPGRGEFALVVKLVPGGPASEWFRRLPVGERVRFTGPMGFFVLELSHPGDVVFAGTGTGIAPLVPMIEDTLARHEPGRVRLYFGARHEDDLFWRDRLAALERDASGRLAITTSLTRPPAGWSGAHGRINPAVFDLVPSLSRPTFYLCGNGAMIRELKAGLVARGIDRKRQIRTEAFFD